MDFFKHMMVLVLGLSGLLFSGCASVYVPSAQHTNLMNEKGELHAAAHAGVNGGDIQAGYAVSDNFGIIGAASFGSSEEEGTADDFHEHSYAEIGGTYFRPIGTKGRYEVMAGVGAGSAESVTQYNFFGPQQVKATGDYTKVFLQNNIGVETGILEAGVAIRLGHVIFRKFETSNTTYEESERGTFFEPSAFARLGWKNVKFETQVGVAGPLQDDIAFDYRTLLFSLGIHLQFNTQ
ncbi:hypothetical protein [Fodinibius halophilus]|uniref:Uncharacterized protein n=1 Tax=Fodinibius halophilus TaxID=1736908 RepID=A0A6M1SX76_9BACT|nr:hypothetical protein [Fodinibius halophilus]NGP88508.1 hypothetical protein [Fodinibius halophilus]